MSKDRKVPDKVQRDRREVLDKGLDAYLGAAASGDKKGAARLLDELKALKLLVPDESGGLGPGPDVAD
jgi:hypothetical protein